jgi:hypothetical protein
MLFVGILLDAKSQEKITPKLREKLVVLSATDKL